MKKAGISLCLSFNILNIQVCGSGHYSQCPLYRPPARGGADQRGGSLRTGAEAGTSGIDPSTAWPAVHSAATSLHHRTTRDGEEYMSCSDGFDMAAAREGCPHRLRAD